MPAEFDDDGGPVASDPVAPVLKDFLGAVHVAQVMPKIHQGDHPPPPEIG